MFHSVLDDGNFILIPESVVDIWAAERYCETHSKQKLREFHIFGEDDLIIMVLGSSFFYDGFSWDNAVVVRLLGPLLTRYGRRKDTSASFKFVFLYGNSISTNGLSEAVRITDEVQGIFFRRNDPDALLEAFSPLISDGRLSEFAQTIASSGRLLTKKLMATECISGYARLLENVLKFPSDSFLPSSISQLQVLAWEWSLFRSETRKPKIFMLLLESCYLPLYYSE